LHRPDNERINEKKKKEFIMAQETNKKEYGMPEGQRLLCRWTMELAAFLKEKHNMERKAAMEKAHLNRELITHLGSGRVWFVYRKEDGTLREACGTLCKGISKKFDEYECKTSRKKADQWPTEVFVYWDLDKEAFRTFKASRLIKIKAATVVNCMHSKRFTVKG
jgi:hypothetical protein